MLSTERRSHVRYILLCSLALLAVSTGTRFSGVSVGLVAFGNVAWALPPEVPHGGIHVLQPFDSADLAKCATGGSGPSKAGEEPKAIVDSKSLLARSSSHIRPALPRRSSFLQSPRNAFASKARAMRKEFICDAGCSANEPELEVSLSQWADWNPNSTGVDMIDSLVGFCKSNRESKDPFIMVVLWRGDVYLKACNERGSLTDVSLYLIGPEDLSLALIFLFGVQRAAPLPSGRPIVFGMYLSDYTSLLDHHLIGPGVPIFAYLGRDTSWVIPWPSSFTLISTQETERWQQDQDATPTQKPWENRDPKAYWIGAVTGPWDFLLDDALTAVPRLKMLKLANEHPQELLAEWSSLAGYGISWVKGQNVSGFLAPRHGSRSVKEVTGIGKAAHKDVKEWQDFKYYINLDGVVLGGRFNKLLSLGGVVLQHQAGYREHIDALAKPYEHYVPIEYDLSDLVEKVKWLQQNDGEAKRIAANGKALADKRMRFEDHVCYVWRALEGLGTKTASSPDPDEEIQGRLKGFTQVTMNDAGMRETMEAFWGKKLEDVSTGQRKMSARGIQLLDWAWDRMKGIYTKVHSHV